jgi:hypothetical protein
MIRLIIKGTVEEARAALDQRRISTAMMLVDLGGEVDAIVNESDLREGPSGPVEVSNMDTIARWFNEPGKAPFPPGTLMHYAVHKAKEE